MVDQTDMAERVYEAVEALVESSPLGLRCEYEYLPTKRAELPCLSMQTLGGDPVVRRYLDGGVVLQYPFALVLRQSSEDTRDRLDAPRVLRELSRALCSLGEPEAVATLDLGNARLRTIARTSLPARIQAQPGMTDYQVTLAVQYKTQER